MVRVSIFLSIVWMMLGVWSVYLCVVNRWMSFDCQLVYIFVRCILWAQAHRNLFTGEFHLMRIFIRIGFVKKKKVSAPIWARACVLCTMLYVRVFVSWCLWLWLVFQNDVNDKEKSIVIILFVFVFKKKCECQTWIT